MSPGLTGRDEVRRPLARDVSVRYGGSGSFQAALDVGRPIIVIDPASKRGGMTSVAALTTDETAAMMAREGRGLLSIILGPEAAFRLGLCHMARAVRQPIGRPYYLTSIEAAACTGTGISAHDRASTIRTAGAPLSTPADLITPGHIMPILAHRDHVATISDLALRIIQRVTSYDVAGWCDLLDDTGEVASVEFCLGVADNLGIPFIVSG